MPDVSKPQPLAGQHEIKLAYSAAEVAKATSLSVSYVRELIAKGEIKSFHVGRRRLVNRDSLLEFLQMR